MAKGFFMFILIVDSVMVTSPYCVFLSGDHSVGL